LRGQPKPCDLARGIGTGPFKASRCQSISGGKQLAV
jgi:hypothetical protein